MLLIGRRGYIVPRLYLHLRLAVADCQQTVNLYQPGNGVTSIDLLLLMVVHNMLLADRIDVVW
jgi:hypothetical protein